MKLEVKLLDYINLKVADIAIGTCWNKQKPADVIDCDRLERVGNKNGHKSTLEHIVYIFNIKNISRALLQELARHRIASFSVKSTRYTLTELKEETCFITEFEFLPNNKMFINITNDDRDRAYNYIYVTGDSDIDDASIVELEILRRQITNNKSTDIAKYNLPDVYLTELVFSINMRSFQNLLSLRTDKRALKEFRVLAKELFNVIPEEHKFMLEEYVKDYSIYEDENNIDIIRKYKSNITNKIVKIIDTIYVDNIAMIKFIDKLDAPMEFDTSDVRYQDKKSFLKEYKKIK